MMWVDDFHNDDFDDTRKRAQQRGVRIELRQSKRTLPKERIESAETLSMQSIFAKFADLKGEKETTFPFPPLFPQPLCKESKEKEEERGLSTEPVKLRPFRFPIACHKHKGLPNKVREVGDSIIADFYKEKEAMTGAYHENRNSNLALKEVKLCGFGSFLDEVRSSSSSPTKTQRKERQRTKYKPMERTTFLVSSSFVTDAHFGVSRRDPKHAYVCSSS